MIFAVPGRDTPAPWILKHFPAPAVTGRKKACAECGAKMKSTESHSACLKCRRARPECEEKNAATCAWCGAAFTRQRTGHDHCSKSCGTSGGNLKRYA